MIELRHSIDGYFLKRNKYSTFFYKEDEIANILKELRVLRIPVKLVSNKKDFKNDVFINLERYCTKAKVA